MSPVTTLSVLWQPFLGEAFHTLQQLTKTDPRQAKFREKRPLSPDRGIPRPTRSDPSRPPLHKLPFHAGGLAGADCTCRSQGSTARTLPHCAHHPHQRLAVLSVRRSTFHPAEGKGKAGKPAETPDFSLQTVHSHPDPDTPKTFANAEVGLFR